MKKTIWVFAIILICMFAFYNLFRKPSSTKLSEIESIIFLGSDETLHISKLVLEQLHLDDSHVPNERNIRIAAYLNSNMKMYEKPLSCFSISHPVLEDDFSSFISGQHSQQIVLLSSTNEYTEKLIFDFTFKGEPSDIDLSLIDIEVTC